MKLEFTEEQISAVKGIPARPKLNKYEATICVNGKVQKPAYFPMTEEGLRAARIWKLTYLAEFNAAKAQPAPVLPRVTEGISLHMRRPTMLPAILKDYLARAHVKEGWLPTLNRHINDPRLNIPLEQLTPKSIIKYVEQEQAKSLKPDSIKRKMQALRSAIDWHYSEYWLLAEMEMPTNPISLVADVRRGYFRYRPDDENFQENVTRSRRLLPGEEQTILSVLDGTRKRKCCRPLKPRTLENGNVVTPACLIMFFRLLINTGLRLAEAYTLRACDVDLQRKVIDVRKSKTTDLDKGRSGKRSVVMTDQLAAWMREYVMQRGLGQGSEKPVFPWWVGETTVPELKRITCSLSSTFAAVFRDADCVDLRVHDLRHEGITRFCEMRYPNGDRMYNRDEVMSFSGHKSEAAFERYRNLFTEDLTPAALLGRRERFDADAASKVVNLRGS